MMRRLGNIVRLQVQVDSIKTGTKPHERYTPLPNLRSVVAIRLDKHGVSGIDTSGEVLPDVHNRLHPHSKYRGNNGISMGFTSHYEAMRARFGSHVTDGIAAEVMLVECDEMVVLPDLQGGIRIGETNPQITIGGWSVAHPCAPFTKFCLKFPEGAKPDRSITDGLQFLEHGMRGFLAVLPDGADAVEIRVGDTVWLP